jgi:hypothetical protein
VARAPLRAAPSRTELEPAHEPRANFPALQPADEQATLGNSAGALHYNSPDCPVSQRSNGSLCANGRLCRATLLNSATAEVRAQKSEGTKLSGVAPDCPVQLEDKRLQRSTAPNPNGCVDVARTGQCTVTVRWRIGLSGAPIASSPCQQLGSGWGYKYPPTTSFIGIQVL